MIAGDEPCPAIQTAHQILKKYSKEYDGTQKRISQVNKFLTKLESLI